MMRSPAELVVEEHWDDATAGVLHEVGKSWLEVISIGELEGSPQDSAPLLQQGISPRGSTTNRHLL